MGYFGNIIQPSSIDAMGVSHLNYAFAEIKDNRIWLLHQKTDTVNFRNLNELKKINPDLMVIISIGGWKGSKHFSDAVLTDTSRSNFALSAVDIVNKYDLDGVDIDWEYPGMYGDSNLYRPEDRENYTLLFKDLREKLDALSVLTHKKYFVTTAIGGSLGFLQHTDLAAAQKYLDYISLMGYDFDESYDNIAAHHSNLFSPPDMPYIYSDDFCVRNLLKVGVKPSKIVMGVPFYGKGKIVNSSDNHGLYQIPVQAMAFWGGYTRIKDSLVNQNGFVRYWDDVSKMPYLFNEEKKMLIVYDDEESMKYK